MTQGVLLLLQFYPIGTLPRRDAKEKQVTHDKKTKVTHRQRRQTQGLRVDPEDAAPAAAAAARSSRDPVNRMEGCEQDAVNPNPNPNLTRNSSAVLTDAVTPAAAAAAGFNRALVTQDCKRETGHTHTHTTQTSSHTDTDEHTHELRVDPGAEELGLPPLTLDLIAPLARSGVHRTHRCEQDAVKPNPNPNFNLTRQSSAARVNPPTRTKVIIRQGRQTQGLRVDPEAAEPAAAAAA